MFQVLSFDPDTSNVDEMAGYGFAVAGLYYQVIKDIKSEERTFLNRIYQMKYT